MSNASKLTKLLAISGGLAMASISGAASATCSPSGGGYSCSAQCSAKPKKAKKAKKVKVAKKKAGCCAAHSCGAKGCGAKCCAAKCGPKCSAKGCAPKA